MSFRIPPKSKKKNNNPTATCYANKGQAVACGVEKVALVLLCSDFAVSARVQRRRSRQLCGAQHTQKKKSLLAPNPPTAKHGVLVVTRGQY